MTFKKLDNVICCALDLTIGVRVISFIGLAVSVTLVTVLLNDKYINDYDKSRTMALALGLDWQHFHVKANSTREADPKGKLISSIVIFYAVTFLIINIVLLLASITFQRMFCIPWLICECIGCLSKIGALIYHLLTDPYNFSQLFVVGSILYVVTIFWWWLIVFRAQLTWEIKKKSENSSYEVENCSTPTGIKYRSEFLGKLNEDHSICNESMVYNSPVPYQSNICYTVI